MINGAIIVNDIEATVVNEMGKASQRMLRCGEQLRPVQDFLVDNGIAVLRIAQTIYKLPEDCVHYWINRNGRVFRGDRLLACPWPEVADQV
jgi:hypothetical protein